MASIRSRAGPGGRRVWQVQVRKRGQLTKTKTFGNRKDAETWGREVERAVDRGFAIPTREEERVTLADALDRYVREVTSHKRSVVAEVNRAKWLIRSPLGRLYLHAIGGRELAQYRDERLADGKAPATVRLELALLSNLYSVARREWGMTTLQNPVALVRRPKPTAGRERRLLPGEEARLLVAGARYREFPLLIRFALETAMRRSEIIGMRREHVDLGKRIVRVPEAKDAREVRGRDVPLSSAALTILGDLPARLDGKVWSLTQAFVTTGFRRIVQAAHEAYMAEMEGAGREPLSGYLLDLRFHDLRHEATSRFFELGLDSMQVSAITGHKTLTMLKRYTHLRAQDLARLLG